jgi:hypothetical protein
LHQSILPKQEAVCNCPRPARARRTDHGLHRLAGIVGERAAGAAPDDRFQDRSPDLLADGAVKIDEIDDVF